MPEYIVFVTPPYGPYDDAGSFDIPEWDLDAALATADRYRGRGWEACIIDYGAPFVPWHAGRPDGPDIYIMARTCDEACIRARAAGYDCTGFRRVG